MKISTTIGLLLIRKTVHGQRKRTSIRQTSFLCKFWQLVRKITWTLQLRLLAEHCKDATRTISWLTRSTLTTSSMCQLRLRTARTTSLTMMTMKTITRCKVILSVMPSTWPTWMSRRLKTSSLTRLELSRTDCERQNLSMICPKTSHLYAQINEVLFI